MIKFLLQLSLVLATFQLHAQGTIRGSLKDSAGKANLSLATITVFKAADTSLITYRLSNQDGEFKVPGVPLNLPCRVVISYSGYSAFRKEFTLTSDAPLDLGIIYLQPSSNTLDEVLVIAERPPVTIKRDTIEFNASSFKTLPTALVEDLLKKLPGVQIDAEGNIMANGKRVNRIMVDGKAFFGDDPKMATRNLPANVIDKIQVTADKDEANRNTNGDLSDVGQVINLTLKKGVKKGWFGKLYGGGGTHDRYEVGGIANIYRDTMQLSVLAFSNNLNRSGFSFKEVQDLGGFSRSGANSIMIMNRGGQTGFALNGISFGGLDAGVSRTSGGGFNLNHAPNKRKSFFLQYFVGNNRNDIRQINNTQQFFHDTIVNSRTTTSNIRYVNNHNVGAGANLKPDSLTDVQFRAQYTYSSTDENLQALVNLDNNKAGLISRGEGVQFNNFYSNRYNHSLTATRRSGTKKGRTLNFFNFLNYNNSLQRYITDSYNEYFVPVYDDSLFNQLRRQDVPTFSTQTSLSLAEPLSKMLTLRFTNRFDYLTDEQSITMYNDGNANGFDLSKPGISNGFQRTQKRFNSYLGLSYKIKKVTVSGGVSAMWQNIHNAFKNIPAPINNRLFNFLPSFNLNWKQLSASYNMNVVAPQISYLIPVPDNTNPFYIRYGNPYLKPVKQHQFYLNNFTFLQASSTTFNFFMNGTIAENDIALSRTVAPNGVQSEVPVNASGTASFYMSAGFGKEYKNRQKFIFTYRISPYVNFNRRPVIVNNNYSKASTFSIGPNLNISLNWNDVVEFKPQYSPSFNRTRYTDPFFKNIKAITHYFDNELIVRWPKKIVWETNVAYRYTSQVAPGLPKSNTLWNAAITLLMFKGDVGMLKLSVYDILNKNNGLTRYTVQNQIVDQQTNVLQRYGLLSFIYNVRNMGAPKKVGGRDRLFLF